MDEDRLDPLPPGFNGGLFQTPDSSVDFGSTQPPAIYVAIAEAIVRGSPYACRPIDVAIYFSQLRAGTLPPAVLADVMAITDQAGATGFASVSMLRIFAYDWEKNHFYNPVVISFFRGVGLRPYAGDQTPWCATFANWCISRSRARNAGEVVFSDSLRSLGTRNASSGSFRCWGRDATAAPNEGDVVVWARRGSITARCPSEGQGHVAFLREAQIGPGGRRRFRVIGGNQGYTGAPASAGIVDRRDVAQAVSERVIGAEFGDLVLHSIRGQS